MAAPIPPIELQRQWISESPTFADWRPFTGDPVRVGTDWTAVIAKAAAWGHGKRSRRLAALENCEAGDAADCPQPPPDHA
jgi:hypothetical protein